MKILMAYDDAGHAVAFDVSTPEQEAIILEGMCKEIAKAGRFEPEEKSQVKAALARKDFETIYQILNRNLIHLGSRGRSAIVEVKTKWEEGLGIINL